MIKRRAVFAVWLVLGAGLPPALAADTADELAAVASQRLKDGDRDAAIEALQAAVKTDPAHGSAGLLITTLHQAGRIEEAYALGERYRREGPRNPRALFRYGWLLAFIGEVERAEVLFRDLVALDKGGIYEAWGNGELAYLARAQGDARGAVAFMERAVAARPARRSAAARGAHAYLAALRRAGPARRDVRVAGGCARVRSAAHALAGRGRRGTPAARVRAVAAGGDALSEAARGGFRRLLAASAAARVRRGRRGSPGSDLLQFSGDGARGDLGIVRGLGA